MMKLFLASEMKHPDSIKKLKTYIGKSLKEKNIVYIPTAANGEFYGSWKGGESVKVARSLCSNLNIIELENFSFIDIYSPLKKADIVWMAGGMSGYLLYWMRRTGLDKQLPEIINHGTYYIGSSAGSMVCAKTQLSAEWLIGDCETGASLIPGLGLIDFEIYPHYEDELLPQINILWKGNELYLLKNGEVIIVEDNEIRVLGEKRILHGRN